MGPCFDEVRFGGQGSKLALFARGIDMVFDRWVLLLFCFWILER